MAKLHRARKALHTTTFLEVSSKISPRKSGGFREISRSESYRREFESA